MDCRSCPGVAVAGGDVCANYGPFGRVNWLVESRSAMGVLAELGDWLFSDVFLSVRRMIRALCVVAWLGVLLLITGGCGSETGFTSYEWTVEETHRWTEVPASDGDGTGFQQLDSTTTGVGFVNRLREEQYLQNRHLVNGSGAAVGDVNGDEWPDVYLARLSGPNALYLNRGDAPGEIGFERVPNAGGAALRDEYSMGTALADVTGDGRLDLLVTTLGGPNVLFENEGGGSFRRIEGAGLHSGAGSTTMALADLNGDRALDLYVANYKRKTVKDIYPPEERRFEQVVYQRNGEYGVRSEFQDHYVVRRQGNRLMRFERGEPDRVYFNDGAGGFEEQDWTDVFRGASGDPRATTPGNWALVARLEDLTGDGTPDLYVCNDFESPDFFYRGVAGTGRFRQVSEPTVRTTSRSSMSIATTDLQRDGDVDFFLADMLGVAYERQQQQVGIATPVPRRVGDVTTRMQEMLNTLQVNRGDGTFVQTSRLAGVEASGWTWSSRFLDVNLDGLDDLLLSNGHAYDAMSADTQMRLRSSGMSRGSGWRESLLQYPDLDLKNVAFRNEGDGTFSRVEDGWGLGVSADVGHGMATGDFDRDGDLDVVINRLNRAAGIYRNEATQPRVAVRLAGRSPNTGGIGAKIRVTPVGSEVPAQGESVIAGGEYVSDSGGTHVFAVGEADSVRIRVRWPQGEETVVWAQSGRIYEVRQPGAEPGWGGSARNRPGGAERDRRDAASRVDSVTNSGSSDRSTFQSSDRPLSVGSGRQDDVESDTTRLFEEVTGRLGHTHSETRYQDFQRQPLLSRRLGQQGPGASWSDLDGDGDEDLLIGTGRGGSIAYYRNDGTGGFSRVQGGALDRTFDRDLTGIVTIPRESGATVLVGRSNYERQPEEEAAPSEILVLTADRDGLRIESRLTFGRDSVGPLALADIDGDGDLDLFAGGRHRPGRYPASASSKIFLNSGGNFRAATSRSRVFSNVGMVTGAVFADLNQDGDPDLLLASEWGPIHYFENQGNGRFADRTSEVGLAQYEGFWRGVDVGDFNNDGRLDLVAANWGWNSAYGRPRGAPRNVEAPGLDRPLRVYYADFDGNGVMDVVEAHYHAERDEYVPYKGFMEMGQAMRYLRRKVKTFERFSQMSLAEIIGSRRFDSAKMKEVNTVSHMVFLGGGEGGDLEFEGHALPWWSQLSAGFAPSVADFDGDGNQDVILSQNFFATKVKIPRQDGGRSVLLRGDGTGQFTAVKGHESGLLVYGEQRAAPAGDIDGDGRVDILITQNGAQTKLFRNVGATPGVRVEVRGGPGNRRAVGAVVRLEYTDGELGPATPITAGSSYWSQHSRTPILGRGDAAVEAVQVRWPDGTTTQQSVAADARSVTISHPGQ